MHASFRIVGIALFLVLFFSLAWAAEERSGDRAPSTSTDSSSSRSSDAPSKATALVTALPVKVDSPTNIIPIAVEVRKSLPDIQTSYVATESVRLVERQKYDVLQNKWINASSSERKELLSQVVEQRHRVLLSTLNSMTVIYQRVHYWVERGDPALVVLRSRYNQSRSTHVVSDFEPRILSLQTKLVSLQEQSRVVRQQLETAPSSVELSVELRSIKTNLSQLILESKEAMREYTVLVQDVFSTSF